MSGESSSDKPLDESHINGSSQHVQCSSDNLLEESCINGSTQHVQSSSDNLLGESPINVPSQHVKCESVKQRNDKDLPNYISGEMFSSPVHNIPYTKIGCSPANGQLYKLYDQEEPLSTSTPIVKSTIKPVEESAIVKSPNITTTRKGFIQVNTKTSGQQSITLKSGTFVGKRSHTSPVMSSHIVGKQSHTSPVIELVDGPSNLSPQFDILDSTPTVLKKKHHLEEMLHKGKQVFHILAQLPCGEPIQRVVVVNQGQDPEQAMSKAVNDVTLILNRRAQEKIAQGYTLDKEIIIEITRIANPNETLQNNRTQSKIGTNYQIQGPNTRVHHSRKSPLFSRSERTPSPPHIYGSNNQYFGDRSKYDSTKSTMCDGYQVTSNTTGNLNMSPYEDFSFDEDSQNDSRESCSMNDSLTNIQWLGSMKGDNLQVVSHKDMRLIASEKQIDKVNKECGKHKRPPYSYMHLIQMAICSKPDKKMTLKDIYVWIEAKFPYYKSNPNKGWRNSIRHNLSLYDIFVREKLDFPGKSSLSYWTLRSDIKPRLALQQPVNLDESLCVKGEVPEPESPVYYEPAVEKKQPPKKRPVPLLPKPNPQDTQTYAIIPIQGGVPVVPSQPILLPATWPNPQYSMVDLNDGSVNHSDSPNIMNCGTTSIKRSSSPNMMNGPRRKQVKIAPKFDLTSLTDHQRCWLSQTTSLDSSELQQHLSLARSIDSGISSLSECSSQDCSSCINDNKGLPKPILYSSPLTNNTRKNKRKRKSPHNSLIQCSPDGGHLVVNKHTGISDILASIEKDLSSPAKQLLKTPTKDDPHLLTSTPFKAESHCPSWISPIRGLLLTEEIDPALFTPPDKTEGKKTSTPLVTTPPSGNKLHNNDKLSVQRSPKLGSLRNLGLAGLTPLKSPNNKTCMGSPSDSIGEASSFGRLLGDIQLDSIIDEGISDMANMSFSQLAM